MSSGDQNDVQATTIHETKENDALKKKANVSCVCLRLDSFYVYDPFIYMTVRCFKLLNHRIIITLVSPCHAVTGTGPSQDLQYGL